MSAPGAWGAGSWRALPLAVLALLTSHAAAAAGPTAMLLPLEAEQVSSDVVEGVAAILAEEIDDRGYRLLPATRRILKMVEACAPDDLTCVAAAADRRGADVALRGGVRLQEGGLRLRLEAIQVQDASRIGVADEALAGDELALRQGVRRAVVQLLTPERFTGTLTVGCNVPKATVFVDGQTRGSTPLVAPISDLTEGSHSVRVEKSGYDPFVQTVEIVYEDRVHLEAVLLRRADVTAEELAAIERAEEAEEEWRGPELGPWPWLIAGAGGAALAGAVAVGIVVMLDATSIEERAAQQVFLFPRDAETVKRARLLAVVANALYATGGALLATGLGLGIWDLLTPPPAERAKPPAAPRDDWEELAEPVAPPPTQPDPDTVAPPPEELAPPAEEAAPVQDGDDVEASSAPDADDLPEGDL